jgi:YHS domain-containing protein
MNVKLQTNWMVIAVIMVISSSLSILKAAASGPHGGSLRQAGSVQIETTVTEAGIQLHVYGQDGQPVSVDQGRGSASLRIEGYAKRYRYGLLPDGKGGLTAPVNLSKIAGRQVEVAVLVVGIPGADGRVSYQEIASVPASETQLAAAAIARQKICPVSGKPLGSMGEPVAVDVNGQTVYVCCAGCASAVTSNPAKYAAGRVEITVTSSTQADAALIARQKVCPVMDEPLGSMGNPIKVMVGNRPIFLCCKGCIKKIRAEPAKYLAMVYGASVLRPEDAAVSLGKDEVRAGVFKVTAADAPFVAAQKRCPVMDEPLDAMGGPFKVNAAGKAIYICCPGCAKKIAADPHKYLNILEQQGVNAPVIRQQSGASFVPAGEEQVRVGVFKVTALDAPFVEAQKRCPVMDEPLDAMGGPFKVSAAGKAIYICCPGCAKKIVAEPQKYLEILARQGVDAPLLR